MNGSNRALVIGLFGTLLFSTAAHAKVIWRGDFETGDRSQWSGTEMISGDRLQVVQDPVRQGKFALQAKVIQGDDPINASGNRNELTYTKDSPNPGDERFYSWSTMWPTSFESANTWQLFTQFHHTGPNGSPPVEMFANGEFIYLRVSGTDEWKVPLDRGVWHDFVLHVKWSPDKTVGFVELWYDGKVSLPKTYAATMFAGQGVYLKQGLYRNDTISQTQTIYHDGMTIATTLDDVMTPSGDTVGNTPSQGLTSTPPATAVAEQGSGSDVQTVKASGCSSSGSSAAAGLLMLLLVALRRPLGLVRRRAR